ncbi:hypothetical protein [Candidatus Bodocaedibacter vickermanii]|uniref:Uncharacterized protein n=1 Tax=Candidatus Bodocaedibacter vickermanii TaxID=2741701 RepID=A0A7L9RSQ0_9PROT|nr:hypothetical protein CPBP_00407 [Candidatus Paracaedibacteraceae bacterium 'Lake Konstanz']
MKYLYLIAVFLVGLIPLSAAEFNPDAVAQQLSNEFGREYLLDGQGEGKYKLNLIVTGVSRVCFIHHNQYMRRIVYS